MDLKEQCQISEKNCPKVNVNIWTLINNKVRNNLPDICPTVPNNPVLSFCDRANWLDLAKVVKSKARLRSSRYKVEFFTTVDYQRIGKIPNLLLCPPNKYFYFYTENEGFWQRICCLSGGILFCYINFAVLWSISANTQISLLCQSLIQIMQT